MEPWRRKYGLSTEPKVRRFARKRLLVVGGSSQESLFVSGRDMEPGGLETSRDLFGWLLGEIWILWGYLL